MVEQAQAAPKRRRLRSPSYPGIDLETALQRAKVLREREGRNFAPVRAIIEHWGYSPKSSGGLITLAALKKFGLLEEQGSGEARKARLSPLALKILLDEREDPTERQRAIQEAALTPPIHNELWREFDGSMPSESNLRYTLRNDRHFSDTAVNEFIDQFKRTIALAKLDESANISRKEEEEKPLKDPGWGFGNPFDTFFGKPKPKEGSQGEVPPVDPPPPAMQVVRIPLPDSPWAALQAPVPMTEEDWEILVETLKLYKRSFVKANPDKAVPPNQNGGRA